MHKQVLRRPRRPLSSASMSESSSRADIISTKAGDKVFDIDRNKVTVTFKQLAQHGNTLIIDLPPRERQLFDEVRGMFNTLWSDPAAYGLFYKDARKEFNRFTTPLPGTVAAWFVGCSTNNGFGSDAQCNPICAGSLQPPMGTQGFEACKSSTYLLKDDSSSLIALHRGNDGKAYVVTSKGTVTPSIIASLQQNGIREWSLITLENGRVISKSVMQPTVNAPNVTPAAAAPVVNNNPGVQTGASTGTSSGMSSKAVWITVIIIIVVAILLIAVFAVNRSMYGKKSLENGVYTSMVSNGKPVK